MTIIMLQLSSQNDWIENGALTKKDSKQDLFCLSSSFPFLALSFHFASYKEKSLWNDSHTKKKKKKEGRGK